MSDIEKPTITPVEEEQQSQQKVAPVESVTEEKKTAEDNGEETTMSLNDFTNKEPLHHSPNDLLEPEIVEDGWELSIPSGFVSALPNNTEWPVVERLIYNFSQEEFDHYKAVQAAVAEQKETLSQLKDAPKTALVLGATGLVGERLVQLLVERGAKRIVAFDKVDDQAKVIEYQGECEVQYFFGNIESTEFMTPLFQDIEAVFNCYDMSPFLAAKNVYERVNNQNVHTLLNLAEESNVKKWIQLTTPATRLPSSKHEVNDINEIQLEQPGSFEYDNDYFRTKALAEIAVQEKNSEKMMTICIAPHLIYGAKLSNIIEGDHFLLPQLLDSAAKGDLRVFGDGENRVDICHVDNACHALILASAKMVQYDQAPAGNFYLITDELPHAFWGIVDDLIVRGGCESLKTRIKAPAPLVRVAGFFSKVLKPNSTLNPHTVNITQNTRTFNIQAAKNELGYIPMTFWKDDWVNISEAILKNNRLPCYNTRFYYEGVQFEGFTAEMEKVDAEKRRQERLEKQQEAARLAEELAKQEAIKKAEQEAKEAEEKKDQISDDIEPIIESEPEAQVDIIPAVVVVAPVVAVEEEKKVEEPVAIVTAPVEEEPKVEEPIKVQEEEVAPVVVEEPIKIEEQASAAQEEEEEVAVVEEQIAPQPEEEAPVANNNNNNSKKGKKGKKH